jgi:hypothetical protein
MARLALALSSAAFERSRVAVAASSDWSVAMPRLVSAAARATALSFSVRVTVAVSTLAAAALAEASARSICTSSLAVSSAASTSPFFTCWFSLTATERTTPDSSLEMSTWVRGCSVPVADTSTVRSATAAGTVV